MGLLGISLAAALELRQLPEGTMVLVEDRPEAHVLALNLIHPAGAARDPEGRSGLAHLVEHARFHGSAEGYDMQLTQLGGWGNAWVDHDVAASWARVPAAEGMALLDLERARLRRWEAPQDLSPLLHTLAAEAAWREVDPLLRQFWPAEHAYARPVMGSELYGVQTAELQNFADTYYDPRKAKMVLVGELSPTLRSFLDSLPAGRAPVHTTLDPGPTPSPLKANERRIWPVPPTQIALRPGLALLAELLRRRGAEAFVWIGEQGGLFWVDGPLGSGPHPTDWVLAMRSLGRQLEEEREDPVRRAQALNLCWDWGTDCMDQLLGGFSSPVWADWLRRALRSQQWPAAPAPTSDPVPPSPQTWSPPLEPMDNGRIRMVVEPQPSRRSVVELNLLCGWDCRKLPSSYLEQLWESRPPAQGRRLGGSHVVVDCDDRRCRIWVDSLSEDLAPTLTNLYDWLHYHPIAVDLEPGDAQQAAVAAVVGKPPDRGGHIPARLGAEELARLRAAPMLVVAAGATEGLEAGLRPWRTPSRSPVYKKTADSFLGDEGVFEADERRVTLLWEAPSPASPERPAWEVAFLSVVGSSASALELRLREELGWVYGFALSEEYGANGSFMRLDLELSASEQEALHAAVTEALERARPSSVAPPLWLARQQDPLLAPRVGLLSRRALWGLPETVPVLPSQADVDRAFSSLRRPIWVVGGALRP